MRPSSLIKKTALVITFVILHSVAVLLLIASFWPIAKWYLNYRPIWGVDFFLVVNLASVLKENFTLPYAFWNYGWFGGWPQSTYPFLTIYITSLLSKIMDIVVSVQVMVLGFSALFLIGAYFLFYRISKNPLLSLILSVLTGFSAGVYQPLTWAGSVPSYSSQAAFPWCLGFLIWFLSTEKYRYLLASALIAGISIFIHPLVFMTYIFPAVAIMIFTNMDKGFAIFSKLKQFAIFIIISLIIGLPQFYSTLNFNLKSSLKPITTQNALSTTKAPPTQLDLDVAQFNRNQVKRIVTDNHLGPFVLVIVSSGLFICGLVVGKKIRPFLKILPFVVLASYFIFYIWLFGQGISIYHGGWYRLFWSVPIWTGALVSILFKISIENFLHFIRNRILRIIFVISCNAAVFLIGAAYLNAYDFKQTINKIIYRSQVSSAHPDVLNYWITDDQREKLKNQLIPSWISGSETNWRLYDPDQTVNLWWNSLYKIPLARGYLDPPIADSKRGYIFLLDASLSENDGLPQLVKVFKYPAETAISNAHFLLDWNAIKYYEGGHVGGTSSPKFPAYLASSLVKKEEVVDLASLKYISRTRTMGYYELKDEVTSPVLAATNASTIGIFATEGGFETVVRAIAERDNINSQRLIPINMGSFIDEYDLKTLKNFDALYLYDYDYKKEEKTFKLLTEYARSGKKVFIDTGVEVKQSEGTLPEFLPVKNVKRKGQGKEWSLESLNNPLTQNLDFSSFSPPIFDDDEWKTSAAAQEDLRDGATPILKNHGKIVLASQKIGSGEVIWSGLNFAYHLSRNHNQEEAKLHIKILESLVDLIKRQMPPNEVKFLNANNRTVKTQGARGVLFKEQAYDGWTAKSESKNLNIFKAGPAYPGYIYIPLPDSGNHLVRLHFGGSFTNKFLIALSFLTILFIFEEVAFGGLILGRIRIFVYRRLTFKVGKWWEKEDEE